MKLPLIISCLIIFIILILLPLVISKKSEKASKSSSEWDKIKDYGTSRDIPSVEGTSKLIKQFELFYMCNSYRHSIRNNRVERNMVALR